MTALNRLSNLLRNSLSAAERPLPHSDDLIPVIASLQKHIKTGTGAHVSEDLQQKAVHNFWKTQHFENLKDARLVSFGMCIPSSPSGPCIMEDRQRFLAVLDAKTGVDQWVNEPRWYRRCYQGLVRSYFAYDAKFDKKTSIAKQNWGDLRDYLHERTQNITDEKGNPDWVNTAVDNKVVFGEDPCVPYAADVFSGDSTKIEHLCEQLGVVKSSWFLRELILAQVQQATKLSHDGFKDLIPRLLALLVNNQVLRDRGLILMLNKYASASQPGINEPLRDASVEWWGNPWLPSNETRWGGVVPEAREMVSEWLKREFIEAFFTKLAEDGIGDRRRANFWLRYAKSMNNIQFALGAHAHDSKDRDFDALRKKMKGLYTKLETNDRSNNAFIMTLGNLVAVEFGGMGNAFYGYDKRKSIPFVFDTKRPLEIGVDARNSLKSRSNVMKMSHRDGIKGWNRWEDMFEADLKDGFNIRPNTPTTRTPSRAASPASASVTSPLREAPSSPVVQPSNNTARAGEGGRHTQSEQGFSRTNLNAYAQAHSLTVEDKSKINGNLWVRTDDRNLDVNSILQGWGFRYKPGKGWWR